MNNKRFFFILIFFFIFWGCEKERQQFYKIPENLDGEIYKKLVADGRFTKFVAAIDKVPGIADELNSSGLFTVFAPTDEAFSNYFRDSKDYKSIDQIPVSELSKMIKFHILKWMIFKSQFDNPGATGDAFDVFTYETRMSESNYKSYSDKDKTFRNIYYENKRVQVYSGSFWAYKGINKADYTSLYGPQALISPNFNVMGSSVIEMDIASGNGVIHVLNSVLGYPRNIAQEIDQNADYSAFDKVLNDYFLNYKFDLAGTKLQGNLGDPNRDGILDSLFRRNYDVIPGIDYEKGFFMTAFVPNNNVLNLYIDKNIIAGFGNSRLQVPYYVWKLLMQAHFSTTASWPTNATTGKANSLLNELVKISSADVEKSKMLSNGILYQLNRVIEPAAFTSVSGEVLLSNNYLTFSNMLLTSGYLPDLSATYASYVFLAPKDNLFSNKGIIVDFKTSRVDVPNDTGTGLRTLSLKEIMDYVGNQVIVAKVNSSGTLDPGFYKTLNGSVVKVDNNGKVTGGDPNLSVNLSGISRIKANGLVVESNNLIIPPATASSYYLPGLTTGTTGSLFDKRTYFARLCKKVYSSSFDFIDPKLAAKYTFLMPSDNALTAAAATGKVPSVWQTVWLSTNPATPVLTTDQITELKDFLKMYVIKGECYSDAKSLGEFESFAIDTKLSVTKNIYLKVVVEKFATGILKFSDPFGNSSLIDNTAPYDQIVKEGVIHAINNLLFTKSK
ncbi:MAG: fasciclin domain-containing protein [Prolixibacteraceae bacterium]